MANDMNGLNGFTTGFIIGGLVGFIAGVLFAPRSGLETRGMLMEKGLEWRDRAEGLSEAARARVDRAVTEGRAAARRARVEPGRGRHRFDTPYDDDYDDVDLPLHQEERR